eukprot:15431942-Alexandrium_andersonii.AAC.1
MVLRTAGSCRKLLEAAGRWLASKAPAQSAATLASTFCSLSSLAAWLKGRDHEPSPLLRLAASSQK